MSYRHIYLVSDCLNLSVQQKVCLVQGHMTFMFYASSQQVHLIKAISSGTDSSDLSDLQPELGLYEEKLVHTQDQ